jgi:hypothetical protein
VIVIERRGGPVVRVFGSPVRLADLAQASPQLGFAC